MTGRGAARPDRVLVMLATMLRPDAPLGVSDPACGWESLLALAAEHRLLPALWSRLRQRGVQPLPDVLREDERGRPRPFAVLQDAYDENAARVADLRAQGEELLGALAAGGVDTIPVKGLHWLLAGWLRDPAARVMVDIDLVVPANRAATAVAIAADVGDQPVVIDDPEGMADHEVITMMAPGRRGSVELQIAPLVRRYDAVLPVDELRAGAITIDVCGRAQRVPNPTQAMTLTIAHAQLQDECHRLLEIPLRALFDVAVVVTAGTALVDWDEVTHHFAGAGYARALAGFAVASDELLGVTLPLSRRGRSRRLAAARAALRHPRLAQTYRETVTLPRALSSARMTRLYRADGPFGRSWARVRHVARGAGRRLAGLGRQ